MFIEPQPHFFQEATETVIANVPHFNSMHEFA
jgi:hypothetical protein